MTRIHFDSTLHMASLDDGILYRSDYDLSSSGLEQNAYINPLFGLQQIRADVTGLWCSKIYDNGNHYIAYRDSSKQLTIYNINDLNTALDTKSDAYHFAFANEEKKYYLSDNSTQLKSYIIGSSLNTPEYEFPHNHIKLLSSEGFITTVDAGAKNVLFRFNPYIAAHYFANSGIDIIDIKPHGISFFFLSSNGSIYAYIEEYHRPLFEDIIPES